MTSSSIFLRDGHASAETLRVEDLEQGGEAVGVAVVGRGREEKPVLEPRGEVADGAGDLRVDGVLLAAGRGGVVRFVEDQQRAAAEIAQPVAERAGIGFVDQQAMRDQEAGVGGPRVDAEAAFPADSLHVVFVEDLERQAEAAFELVLPLKEHGRRAGDDDFAGLLAEQQLAGDQAGLDGFAQADVIGDEEVDPRQAECLAERLELVGIEADPGAEWGLEQPRVRRGDAVPAEGVQVGGEEFRRVEPAFGDGFPGLAGDDLAVDLAFPEHLERLALGVVVDAREADERAFAGAGEARCSRRDRGAGDTRAIWPDSGAAVMVLTSWCAPGQRALFIWPRIECRHSPLAARGCVRTHFAVNWRARRPSFTAARDCFIGYMVVEALCEKYPVPRILLGRRGDTAASVLD